MRTPWNFCIFEPLSSTWSPISSAASPAFCSSVVTSCREPSVLVQLLLHFVERLGFLVELDLSILGSPAGGAILLRQALMLSCQGFDLGALDVDLLGQTLSAFLQTGRIL